MVDYTKKIEESIDYFSSTSFNNTISILEWFYNMRNYKIIFEDETMSNLIYDRLLSLEYKELDSAIEEAFYIRKLLRGDSEEEMENIGSTLISLIMSHLKEHKSLEPYIRQFIEIYNEKFNKSKTYDKMMNSLKESIGEDIVFVVIIKNELKLLTGKLEEVDAYKSLTINGEVYPFIGNNIAINKITTNAGELLFNNSNISIQDELDDEKVVEKKREGLFKDNYKSPIL